MTPGRSIRPVAACVLLAVVGLLLGIGPAAPAGAGGSAADLPDLSYVDPVVTTYDAAVTEAVRVRSRNGLDHIWVDVVRPNITGPVPTILIASPYYNTLGRGWRIECKTPHQSPPGGLPTSPGGTLTDCADKQTPFPEWYDEYFVPRGYAVAQMDVRGTRNSTGCQVYGDRDEVFDAVDVIDWIADQDWSNGKVGMTGGSYDGILSIGAAAEQPQSGRHPDALAAIIPLRAVGAWYDAHFLNGVQSLGHMITPALFTSAFAAVDTQNSGTADEVFPARVAERKACIPTFGAMVNAGYWQPYRDADHEFWRERDYVADAQRMRAAPFFVQGLFDFNAKPQSVAYLWQALPKHLPKKLWWYDGGHVDPACPTPADCGAGAQESITRPFARRYVHAVHRWFAQHLKGVEAGAMRGAPVRVQRHDGRFEPSRRFPAAGRHKTLALTSNGRATAGRGGRPGSVAYDDSAVGGRAPSSTSFVTAPFRTDTRLSGALEFHLQITAEGPDTSIAVTVDVLPPGAADDAPASVRGLHQGRDDEPMTLTYGWLRAWYRDSVAPGPTRPVPRDGAPLTPGEATDVAFPSLHTDVIVPKGHRLRFRFSNTVEGTYQTVPTRTGGVIRITTGAGGSVVRLPTAPRGR